MAKILVLLLLISCATSAQNPSKELEDYRTKLLEMSGDKLGTYMIPLNFIEPEKYKDGTELVGRCRIGLFKSVDIVEAKWYSLIERRKLLLLAHEFKHCQCFEKHTDDMIGKCPKSLMHTYTMSNDCAIINWNRYKKEIERGCEDR